MATKIATVCDCGHVEPYRLRLARGDKVVWKGEKKSWKVIFGDRSPFRTRLFDVPAKGKSRPAVQRADLRDAEVYIYKVKGKGPGGKDPEIEIIP